MLHPRRPGFLESGPFPAYFTAKLEIRQSAQPVHVSSVTLWEIALKVRIGKM
jgi:PIN domain nuclease of toxin-antitoxin system